LQKQNGNFLLQALLALTLVFAFMPFLANKLAARDMSAKMYSAKTSIETLHDVARVYLRDKSIQDGFNYGNTNYSGQTLIDTLMPYGLPSGFNTTTSLNQNISLDINKEAKKNGNGYTLEANVVATRGNLSDYQLAELARMVGFFAHASDGNIYVSVPVDAIYSDLVSRRETDEHIGFLTELDMNWNRIENVGELHAESGNFYRARIDTLALMGGGLKSQTGGGSSSNANVFRLLKGDKFRFNKKDSSSPALSVSGDLAVQSASSQSVAGYGDYLKNFNMSGSGEIKDLIMSPFLNNNGVYTYGKFIMKEKPGFENKLYLTIGGSLNAQNTEMSASSVSVVGTNLWVEGSSIESSSENTGVNTGGLYVSKITFSDASFSELKGNPSAGNDLAFIELSGVSSFPDVVLGKNNDFMTGTKVVQYPNKNYTTSCPEILGNYFGKSGEIDKGSLMQNILCQYIYLERLERRINCVLCGLNVNSSTKCGC
jgi:hypothetical protein